MEEKRKIMRKKSIYLDYAASTPVDPVVVKEMMPYLKEEFGNPSSVHQLGQRARAAVEMAREQVAAFLGCVANEVVFTSGATEANNLAIQGIVKAQKVKPHVITSTIEHESVLTLIQALEKEGTIEVSYIAPSKEGVVGEEDVTKALRKNTKLVSIMYANSEVGTVQPIKEIAQALKDHGVIFHTDAVQAAQYLKCNTAKLGVDLLTLSAHKIYGPKGVGTLYIKKGTPMNPLFQGGGQEQDIRSGTENVPGIVGMGKAAEELLNPKKPVQDIKVRQLRDWLQKEIQKKIPQVTVTTPLEHRLLNNLHLMIEGVEGKDVVLLLDQKGIAASTGSACSERSQEPSHVLLALGYDSKEALSAVRLSLGKYTKKEEAQKTVKVLQGVVEQLRQKK
jgi:cysteine desulfurase